MKNHIKSIIISLLLVFLVAAVGGCGQKNEQAETNNLNLARTIRVGDQPNYPTAKIALEKGFFADEFGDEYTFTVDSFNGGPALTEALSAGQIDFAMYADLPAVQAKANQTDIKIIATFWKAADAYSLLASEQSGIESLADLSGKTFAIKVGTQGHKLILKFLESEGISPDSVNLVNLDSSEANAALATGDVDGIISHTYLNEKLIGQTGAHLVSTSEGYDNTVIYQIANNKFASENPDIVARYLKVLQRTNEWIAENLDEASEITAELIGSDADSIKLYWSTRDFVIGWDATNEKDIADTITFANEQGTIQENFDVNELVDLSYLKAAGLYK